jgi:hypothetical protein
VSQVFALQGVPRAPAQAARTERLADRPLDRLSRLRRAYFRRLIRRADVLTFHSCDNLAMAATRLPGTRRELVLFGNEAATITPPVRDPAGAPLIISVGNDVHRNWPTLIATVARYPDWRLRIVSTKCPPALAEGIPNVEIAGVSSNPELTALWRQATIAVVPLSPNAHASGITVLQEAALNGVAAIASDVGGLRDISMPIRLLTIRAAMSMRAMRRRSQRSDEGDQRAAVFMPLPADMSKYVKHLLAGGAINRAAGADRCCRLASITL